MKNNNKGFTLAEVLIALTVLGIIASLTIPTVIQKQREAANRTKIKKAMTVYDRMFAKMIIENNLKSDKAVRDFVKTDCSNTASYFKIAESLSTENSCTFKTSDGVFWNIEDIFHPIISLNKDDLDDLTSKNTFRMVTTFDPKTGAFRTNDLQYEIASNGAEDEMKILFSYVKPEIGDGNSGAGGDDKKDDTPDDSNKPIWEQQCSDTKTTGCLAPVTLDDTCFGDSDYYDGIIITSRGSKYCLRKDENGNTCAEVGEWGAMGCCGTSCGFPTKEDVENGSTYMFSYMETAMRDFGAECVISDGTNTYDYPSDCIAGGDWEAWEACASHSYCTSPGSTENLK